MTPEEPEFLTPTEVAEKLRVSRKFVYELIRSGELTAIRVGRGWRIYTDTFHEYVARRVFDTRAGAGEGRVQRG